MFRHATFFVPVLIRLTIASSLNVDKISVRSVSDRQIPEPGHRCAAARRAGCGQSVETAPSGDLMNPAQNSTSKWTPSWMA
jgi:hypothetical protein